MRWVFGDTSEYDSTADSHASIYTYQVFRREQKGVNQTRMDIKDEFYHCLKERGLFPECHVDRFITFTYNGNTFSIRPLHNIVGADIENVVCIPLETEMFSLILYNLHSYELPESERGQMLNIAANINLKYKGIKTILGIDDDCHVEIQLQLLNSFSRELKNNLEKYLDNMILANDEITELLEL